jgi:hypothetical protein
MTFDLMRRLVESIDEAEEVSEGRDVPGKRDGTGPFKGSFRGKRGMKGRRKEAGEECPAEEDSELQQYATEPSGGMAEAMLTVEDVEKLCPECAQSMRERNISGVKLESVLQAGIFEESDDEDAILIEKEGDGWPKKLKKGRFTQYCKGAGFDGPSIACAKKAMDSDDESVRGMASFYMNTVKPKGKTATAVKGEEECDELGEKCKREAEESMAYDAGMTETVIIDAVKTWAAHPLAEGIRMTSNTVMIGNTRVAERNFEAKHARMLKSESLTEDAEKRTRDLIERGLRDAGYKIELVDAFVS